VTQDKKREILEHADIRIKGNLIEEIGKNLAKRAHEETIDCAKRIVMPGLINAHTHLGMSGMRGLKDDEELDKWLKEIIAAEHTRTRKEVVREAMLGAREALRTGTTTVCDMYDPGDAAVEAAKETGIRLVNTPAYFSAHKELKAEEIPK